MYSIWIVSPSGYIHSRSFEPQALALQAAFKELGHGDVAIVTDPAHIKGYGIVLAANLLPDVPHPLPDKLIIYNMEQIQKGSSWLRPGYTDLLKRYPVWDYSARNIEKFKTEFGIEGVALCGVGYMPVLSCIAPQEEDIDVTFIGSGSDRRIAVLKELAAKGKKVTFGYNMYGKERDTLIARSRILLNLHYYEAQVFEITRISYLLANRKCVVSETGHDEALESPMRKGVAFTSYANITQTCIRLLDNPDKIKDLANKGFECFSALSQVPMLQRALAATSLA